MIKKQIHQQSSNMIDIAYSFNLDVEIIIDQLIKLKIIHPKTYLATDFAINNNYAINITDVKPQQRTKLLSLKKIVHLITGVPPKKTTKDSNDSQWN
jgi:hypothetical protein